MSLPRGSHGEAPAKPRLVFFQFHYDRNLPEFLLIHKREHARCLSEFFEVTLVHEDCDFGEICERHEPDLVLFESGVNHVTCRRLEISNLAAHPQVPRVGLHNADPFCDARAGLLSDMDHRRFEAVFAISTTAAEHNPEIADRLLVWPNFVDPDVYRDYGEWKSIPVLLAGNRMALYPWRRRTAQAILNHFPALLLPHPGYGAGAAAVHFMYGTRYARTINASWVVPTCGTVANELVRKHFEVPAARSCLVSERSPALEAAGFVDMENCILADEHDVVDKLARVFRDEELLRRITDAGHALVHSRHTLRQRDQVRQWFELRRSLPPRHRIIQPGPFEPLVAVPETPGLRHGHLAGNGLHLALLREGDEKLASGRYAEAETLYLRCANYIPWMPEPRLRVSLCQLQRGDASGALSTIDGLIRFVLVVHGAEDPDPVEWAYSIVSLLCLGRLDEAAARAAEFPRLHHPQLERARAAAWTLSGRLPASPERAPTRRATIHVLPDRGPERWTESLCQMLRACGRPELATALANAGIRDGAPAPDPARTGESAGNGAATRPGWVEGSLARPRPIETARARMRRLAAKIVHGLERRFGYFLPYHLSEARKDEFYRAIQASLAEEPIGSALIVGGTPAKGSTEAFIAGLLANPGRPRVFCIPAPRVPRERSRHPDDRVRWLEPGTRLESPEELAARLDRLRREEGAEEFGAVLIDGSQLAPAVLDRAVLERALRGAGLVLVEGINSPGGHRAHRQLLEDAGFVLLLENPDLRGGYGMFRRASVPMVGTGEAGRPVIQGP